MYNNQLWLALCFCLSPSLSTKNSETKCGVKVPWQHHSPTDNMLLGLTEREEGGAEAADRLGFSLFRWDKKLSLSAQALLTFIGLLKMANAARPRGKWSVCFALNTLLTDCRAGMVQRTQTVCRPGRAPPFPTLVPLRQGANEGSTLPCPCLKKNKQNKTCSPWDKTGKQKQAQDMEFINR